MKFFGRDQELKILRGLGEGRESAFVPVYGRRRVGKSELIVHFMEGRGLYFAGKQAPRGEQIREFLTTASRALDDPLVGKVRLEDWKEALEMVVARWSRVRDDRLILALDEFQWMAQASPELPSVLQELWDRDWSKSGKLLLLLCGSYLGFMEKEVLGRKSPLFGRRTAQIHLQPFNHVEAAEFHRGYSQTDQAAVHAICGGVPFYLVAWEQTKSVAQNVARLFLDESGILYREPDFLLREELRDLTTYHAVLMQMAAGASFPGEIARRAGVDPRTINYHLGVLCDLGYVARNYPLSGRRASLRHVRYKLEDSALRFWFRFVFPNQSLIRALGPARAYQELIARQMDSWLGDGFERLARACLPRIYQNEGVMSAFQTGQYWDSSVQIDVVGIRDDGWIDLGECKWGNSSGVLDELERKIPLFPNPANATIGRRLFLHTAPKNRKFPENVRIHTLADLY